MRRFILYLTVILVLFLGGGTKKKMKGEIKYTEGVYEVNISASLLYNNSVGKEWHTVYTCDDSCISSGERWTVSLDTQKNGDNTCNDY